MEEKTNVADILRCAPNGLRLYSPIFGECELMGTYSEEPGTTSIHVRFGNDSIWKFNQYGECLYGGGDTCIFPSKSHLTWKDWQSSLFRNQAGIVVKEESGGLFMLGHAGLWTSDGSYDIVNFDALTSFSFASLEDAGKFFSNCRANGFTFNKDLGILEKTESVSSDTENAIIDDSESRKMRLLVEVQIVGNIFSYKGIRNFSLDNEEMEAIDTVVDIICKKHGF